MRYVESPGATVGFGSLEQTHVVRPSSLCTCGLLTGSITGADVMYMLATTDISRQHLGLGLAPEHATHAFASMICS
eukprot:scaffold9511_cov182-Skeletonema_dohrnii-CCMP3373.AAC.11